MKAALAGRTAAAPGGRRLIAALLFAALGAAPPPTPEYSVEQIERLTRRWADEYVRFIMLDEERELLDAITHPAARLQFIEDFWERRDPNPDTPENEFREDYAQRYAYVLRHFGSGKPGWKTDRGRVYLMLGPPNRIQHNPAGRNAMERPSEIWTYNAVGNRRLEASFDLNFVDFTGTGDFQLVSNLDLTAPARTNFGPILSEGEAFGLLRDGKRRLIDEYTGWDKGFIPNNVAFEQFNQLEKWHQVAATPAALAPPLSEEIKTRLAFDPREVGLEATRLRGTEGRTALPLAVQIPPSGLTSEEQRGRRAFQVDLYAELKAPGGAAVASAARELPFEVDAAEQRLPSVLVSLDLAAPPGRYQLTVAVRDTIGGRVGLIDREVELLDFSGTALRLSDLLLASQVLPYEPQAGASPPPFLYGRFAYIPRIGGAFERSEALHLLLTAYNLGLDAGGRNSVELRYAVEREQDGSTVPVRSYPAQYPAPTGQSDLAIHSGIPLRRFEKGAYRLRATVIDRIAAVERSTAAAFRVE